MPKSAIHKTDSKSLQYVEFTNECIIRFYDVTFIMSWKSMKMTSNNNVRKQTLSLSVPAEESKAL